MNAAEIRILARDLLKIDADARGVPHDPKLRAELIADVWDLAEQWDAEGRKREEDPAREQAERGLRGMKGERP